MCVGYARYDLSDDIPVFVTMEEWLAKKSTKFDICVRISLYLLVRDDAPDIEVKDGDVFFPPMPEGKYFTRLNKILIYQEFPSLGGLLRNVSHRSSRFRCLLMSHRF